jgi:hypothetical protein
MNTTQTTAIEPGCRIRLPEEWAESLGMRDEVVLVRTEEGILVRPLSLTTWDDVFADNYTNETARNAYLCLRMCGMPA